MPIHIYLPIQVPKYNVTRVTTDTSLLFAVIFVIEMVSVINCNLERQFWKENIGTSEGGATRIKIVHNYHTTRISIPRIYHCTLLTSFTQSLDKFRKTYQTLLGTSRLYCCTQITTSDLFSLGNFYISASKICSLLGIKVSFSCL